MATRWHHHTSGGHAYDTTLNFILHFLLLGYVLGLELPKEKLNLGSSWGLRLGGVLLRRPLGYESPHVTHVRIHIQGSLCYPRPAVP